MPKAKYDRIYSDLKRKIDRNDYETGSYLPSENALIEVYDCSRNTVRRAISHLVAEGYVQPHHGKGVRVIYSEAKKSKKYDVIATTMDGFSTVANSNGHQVANEVIACRELQIDERQAVKTGFDAETDVYLVQRLRIVNGSPRMIDSSLIRKDVVSEMNPDIAKGSLFNYYKETLGMEIATVKRTVTIERATPFDEKYLELDDYNCVPVLTSKVFNGDGIQFEYTESRHRPENFIFNTVLSKSQMPK